MALCQESIIKHTVTNKGKAMTYPEVQAEENEHNVTSLLQVTRHDTIVAGSNKFQAIMKTLVKFNLDDSKHPLNTVGQTEWNVFFPQTRSPVKIDHNQSQVDVVR